MSADPSASSQEPSAPLSPQRAPLDTICVSITGQTPDAMQTNAAALLPAFPFQEFRLDYLADTAYAIPQLAPFLRENATATFLATCRPLPSGGCFHGSAQQELQMLLAAADAGFALVDLSLESAEQLGQGALDSLRERGVRVLVSFHDFAHTGDLDAVLQRISVLSPDIAKIVSTAQSLSDSLRVLQFLQANHAQSSFPLVALAMGEHGALSRVLGPRAGGAFTFAAATEGEATAPGQLTAHTLADLYRIRELTPATRIFGVAGDPIHSSLSPLMLNTAFRDAGIDAVYLPLRTSSAEELFAVARALPLEGFSVTMPLKQAVLPLLDQIDPLASKIGAVNTVKRTADGRFHGFNTDVAGIVDPLQRRLKLEGARVLVLGAGGAARAAVFGCVEAGAQVCIQNRTAAAAMAFAQEAGASVIGADQLVSEHFDAVINSTPAGMHGNSFTLPIDEPALNTNLVFDLVYNPLRTPLLKLAQSKDLGVIEGVEMFVHQGARQFEIWTGQGAPRAAMDAAVRSALDAKTV